MRSVSQYYTSLYTQDDRKVEVGRTSEGPLSLLPLPTSALKAEHLNLYGDAQGLVKLSFEILSHSILEAIQTCLDTLLDKLLWLTLL